MRADEKIVVARMDEDIVDWNDRQVVLEPRPLTSAIHGDVHPDLVPGKEEARRAMMLRDDVYGPSVGEPVRDERPALAVVFAGVYVGRIITVAMAVEGRVDPTLCVRRWLDTTDVGTLR